MERPSSSSSACAEPNETAVETHRVDTEKAVETHRFDTEKAVETHRVDTEQAPVTNVALFRLFTDVTICV